MTEGGDEQGPPQFSSGRPARLAPRAGGVIRSIHGLEHAQDVVAGVVGVVLRILAAILLVSGIAAFFHPLALSKDLSALPVTAAATTLPDEGLLVLIPTATLHTGALSL